MKDLALLLARLGAGGLFLLAGWIKAQNPLAFVLAIEGFKLFPEAVIPFFAFTVPVLELLCGAMLVCGFGTREAGFVLLGMTTAFTLAIASVLLRGMKVDCGCFGSMFGEAKPISWLTIGRNLLFLGSFLALTLFGGGRFSIDGWRSAETAPNS